MSGIVVIMSNSEEIIVWAVTVHRPLKWHRERKQVHGTSRSGQEL